MYVSDPSSSKRRCGYSRLQHIIVTCFSILLCLTFQQFLFKVCKCISVITSSIINIITVFTKGILFYSFWFWYSSHTCLLMCHVINWPTHPHPHTRQGIFRYLDFSNLLHYLSLYSYLFSLCR